MFWEGPVALEKFSFIANNNSNSQQKVVRYIITTHGSFHRIYLYPRLAHLWHLHNTIYTLYESTEYLIKYTSIHPACKINLFCL